MMGFHMVEAVRNGADLLARVDEAVSAYEKLKNSDGDPVGNSVKYGNLLAACHNLKEAREKVLNEHQG